MSLPKSILKPTKVVSLLPTFESYFLGYWCHHCLLVTMGGDEEQWHLCDSSGLVSSLSQKGTVSYASLPLELAIQKLINVFR